MQHITLTILIFLAAGCGNNHHDRKRYDPETDRRRWQDIHHGGYARHPAPPPVDRDYMMRRGGHR